MRQKTFVKVHFPKPPDIESRNVNPAESQQKYFEAGLNINSSLSEQPLIQNVAEAIYVSTNSLTFSLTKSSAPTESQMVLSTASVNSAAIFSRNVNENQESGMSPSLVFVLVSIILFIMLLLRFLFVVLRIREAQVENGHKIIIGNSTQNKKQSTSSIARRLMVDSAYNVSESRHQLPRSATLHNLETAEPYFENGSRLSTFTSHSFSDFKYPDTQRCRSINDYQIKLDNDKNLSRMSVYSTISMISEIPLTTIKDTSESYQNVNNQEEPIEYQELSKLKNIMVKQNLSILLYEPHYNEALLGRFSEISIYDIWHSMDYKDNEQLNHEMNIVDTHSIYTNKSQYVCGSNGISDSGSILNHETNFVNTHSINTNSDYGSDDVSDSGSINICRSTVQRT
jgi:hypothetical protein